MDLNQGVSWFTSFYDHDPSRNNICIFFTKKVSNPRCRSDCTLEDTDRAIQLYRDINAASRKAVTLDVLREYILCNCCRFAKHRDRIGNTGLLMPLAQRWQAEIQSRLDQAVTNSVEIPPQPVRSSLRYNFRSREVGTSLTSTSHHSTHISQPPLSEFQPHIEKPTPSDSVSCKLLECLKGGEERDFETGSLYIYHRDSSPGYVKIGWTASSVGARLERWEEKCGYKPKILFSIHEIPNAHRVENLTHYELIKYWRRERMCKKEDCQISHQEWFEISKEQAMLVLMNWAIFFSTAKPYSIKGELKDEWKKAIAKLDSNGEAVTAQKLLQLHAEMWAEEKLLKTEPIKTEPPSEIGPLLETKPLPKSEPSQTLVPQADTSPTPFQVNPCALPASTSSAEDLNKQLALIRQSIEDLKLLMLAGPLHKDAKNVSDQAESPATENEPTWEEEDITLVGDQLSGSSLKKEITKTLEELAGDVATAKANTAVTAVEVLDTQVPLEAEVVVVQA